MAANSEPNLIPLPPPPEHLALAEEELENATSGRVSQCSH